MSFGLTSRPEPEVRLWAVEGFAAGIQPWWHYVNAYHEDRRMYDDPAATRDERLVTSGDETIRPRAKPVATVGVVDS